MKVTYKHGKVVDYIVYMKQAPGICLFSDILSLNKCIPGDSLTPVARGLHPNVLDNIMHKA